jgi:hypothetical protein
LLLNPIRMYGILFYLYNICLETTFLKMECWELVETKDVMQIKIKSVNRFNVCHFFCTFSLIHYCVHVCTRKVWLLELYSLATSPKVYPQVHPNLYSKGFFKKPLLFPSLSYFYYRWKFWEFEFWKAFHL